jgi:hypothetical protein
MPHWGARQHSHEVETKETYEAGQTAAALGPARRSLQRTKWPSKQVGRNSTRID